MQGYDQIQAILNQLSLWLLPGLFAITVHEAAHGYAALWLGDKTAYFLGRTSLNPVKHIDPIGTVIVPLSLLFMQAQFLFGWANPVPINTRNLRKPVKDMALIALAGPVSNFVMALLWLGLAKLAIILATYDRSPPIQWLFYTSRIGIFFNIILGVFNLLPIPPLDGSKIIQVVLPARLGQLLYELEPYGLFILVGLIFTGVLQSILAPPVIFFMQLAEMALR